MTTKIRPILPSPQILALPNGKRAICFDAAPVQEPPRLTIKADGESRTVVGYRQTKEPAANGGKANKNFFRFRNGGMRAFARSFRAQPFITAHERGDVRMRGGTITDAYIEETDAEMLVLYELALTEPWAKAGFANGTIDRFSMGAWPTGEVFCTVHNAPLWSKEACYDSFCWPGFETDGKLVELEYQDAEGLELSGVNVPAVDDTYVVDRSAQATPRAERWDVVNRLVASVGAVPWNGDVDLESLRAMAEIVGRSPPGLERFAGGARVGDFSASTRRPSIARDDRPPEGNAVNHEELCRSLGLPITSTPEQVRAKLAELNASAAQTDVLRTQLADTGRTAQEATARATELAAAADRAHVETQITRLRETHEVTDQVVSSLRTAASGTGGSRSAFDTSLLLVEASAPKKTMTTTANNTGGVIAAGGTRPPLQSDSRPAEHADAATIEPDAYELNRGNTNLSTFAKWGGVSTAQIREHGSRTFNVVPDLGKLSDATAAYESAEVGRRIRKEIA